jgi:CheY-like chemotaxis protein
VSVFLPVLPASSLARDEAAERGPVPGGGETILLAEDEASLRRLSARYLTGLGYRVVEAPNGESALEAWRRSEGRISALITDMVMPGSVDGPGLARALRAEAPDLRVVFVSGYHSAQDSVARDRRSVFLQKPFAPEELARVLRATLDAS